MKIGSVVFCLLAVHPWTVFAAQMDERMARAAAIQEAEDNNKLCQLGSPACKGGLPAVGMALPSRSGSAGLPPMPTGATGNGIGVASTAAEPSTTVTQNHRPKAVGLSVVGAERHVEVSYKGALKTLSEGDELGGWSLASITNNGATWERVAKATKGGQAKRKSKSVAKREYDTFGSPALATPVVVQ
jgi:hypothetical protein